jgi:hypothetical protein
MSYLTALPLLAVLAAPALPPASHLHARVDNPWFPLVPGTRYVYVGVKDRKPARDVLLVTHRTASVGGAPCVVVDDRLWLSGKLAERTTDWYSQDDAGTVWYLGERTAELDAHGHVTSTAGSWQTGSHGAQAGVFMPASPRPGTAFRQEYWKGQAEDHFRVLAQLRGQALLTAEWTPLEPGALDHKLYVRGIGTVLEQAVRGGDERLDLVSVSRTG